MIRGTTPTHTFTLPFHSSLVQSAMIIYAQNDKEVFHKDIYECVLSDNTISTTLTQEDTLKFNHRFNVQVQVRILTVEGVAMASYENVISCGKCLNDEVIF